jgi:alpha 1,3-glucosidase
LLPYWYTLFKQNEETGIPPMRPLWTNYPDDIKTFAMQDQHLVGDALLVHPVTDKGASSVEVYLPKGVWYDFYSYGKYSAGSHTINVNDDTIPVYQRGGSIIPTKQRIRRSSALMKRDPYTLFIALDENGYASGSLYTDDGESYDYKNGKYLKLDFTYENNQLEAKVVNPESTYETPEWVERVVILGLQSKPSSIQVHSKSVGSVNLESEGQNPIVIRKPGVLIKEDWQLKLTF